MNKNWRKSKVTLIIKKPLINIINLLMELSLVMSSFYKASEKPNKITIVELFDIGDVILTLPGVRRLRKAYPKANIRYVASSNIREILSMNPDINQVICIPTTKNPLNPAFFIGFLSGILKCIFQGTDVVIVPEYGLRNSLFALFIPGRKLGYFTKSRGISVPQCVRSSIVDSANRKKRKQIYPDFSKNIFKRCDEVFSILSSGDHSKIEAPQFWNKSSEENIKRLLGKKDFEYFVIHPFGRWALRSLPVVLLTEIIENILNDYNGFVYIVGSKQDRDLLQGLNQNKNVSNLSGQLSLSETALLIKGCKLFIGVDSGILQIANVLQVPRIGLFGPSDPDFTGPFGQNYQIVQEKSECSPCDQITCIRNESEPACMNKIDLNKIKHAIDFFIKRNSIE